MKLLNFSTLDAHVTGYLHENHDRVIAHRMRPAMVVCPGGGYDHLSKRETDPPALAFFSEGYNVFLLSYSIGEYAGQKRPLNQLASAVAHIRRNSEAWGVDPNKIAVMGFSAGGHLAASLGAYWQTISQDAQPNALVLCYPVITMGQFTHPGTRRHVTGGDPTLEVELSIEHQVTDSFPPTFLWHTVDDGSVPMENSLLLAGALRKNGVPFECHFFAHGEHGLSTCTREVETPSPECRPWLALSQTWLNKQFDFEP